MADGVPGACGLLVTQSVVKESVFALVPVQTRLPFYMGTGVVITIMSQGSVLLIDARVCLWIFLSVFLSQLIGRSVRVSVSLSVSQLVRQSVFFSFCPLVSHSFSRSVSQGARQSASPPVRQSVSSSVLQSISPSVRQSIASQSASRSVSHLI